MPALNEAPRQHDKLLGDSLKVDEATLERILQPDEALAAEGLDHDIQAADADPETDPEALELLRFQRSMVDMTTEDAYFAAQKFAEQTGLYASHLHTGGRRPPQLHDIVLRDSVVPRKANEQRWRITGIDPSSIGDTPVAHAHRSGVQQEWRKIRDARQAMAAAQAAEVLARERLADTPISGLGIEGQSAPGLAD